MRKLSFLFVLSLLAFSLSACSSVAEYPGDSSSYPAVSTKKSQAESVAKKSGTSSKPSPMRQGNRDPSVCVGAFCSCSAE